MDQEEIESISPDHGTLNEHPLRSSAVIPNYSLSICGQHFILRSGSISPRCWSSLWINSCWTDCLTLQEGPESRLTGLQQERFQVERRLLLNSLFNNSTIWGQKQPGVWQADQCQHSLYLLIYWQFGRQPQFMVLHSQIEGVMLPANNISTPPDRSVSAQARRGMGPGQSLLAAMFVNMGVAAHTPKDAHWRRERAASSPMCLSSRERKVWKGRTWPSTPSQPHSCSVVKPTLAFWLEGATGGLCEDHWDGSGEFHVHVGEDMFGESIRLRNSQGHEDLFEWSKEGKAEWGCGTCNWLQNDTGRVSLSLRVSSGSQPLAQLEQEKFGAFESWTGPRQLSSLNSSLDRRWSLCFGARFWTRSRSPRSKWRAGFSQLADNSTQRIGLDVVRSTDTSPTARQPQAKF